MNTALEAPFVSEYVHSHEVAAGVIGLYHPFGHEVAFLTIHDWNNLIEGNLESVPTAIVRDLILRRFLVKTGDDEASLRSVAAPAIKGFMSLWLLVVQTCNMGCTYCVVEAEEQTKNLSTRLPVLSQVPQGKMTTHVAAAALETFRRSLSKHRQPMAKVTIYGGEPLLNRPLLTDVIPLIRALDWPGKAYPTEILCFTNGIIYDEALTALFREHGVTVGMSIDGTKVQHDGARKRLDGKGTYDRVVETYRRYVAAGVAVGVSCTIGTHNAEDLPEAVRSLIQELGAASVQLQTPIQMPGSKNPNYVEMRDVARATLDAFKVAREAGVEEGLAMRRLSRFVDGAFHHRDCFAVGGELAVSPDGTVGPCHNATIGGAQYFRGSVLSENFDPESQSNFIEWHARMPVNMPGCHGCSFIGLCGGGCPYNSLITKGSIWEKDPQQCGYMEEFVNWLLEDVWERFISNRGVVPSSDAPFSRGMGVRNGAAPSLGH